MVRLLILVLAVSGGGCAHYFIPEDAANRLESLDTAHLKIAAVPALREPDLKPVYLKGRLVALEPRTTADRPGYRRARALSHMLPAGIIVLSFGGVMVGIGGFLTNAGQPTVSGCGFPGCPTIEGVGIAVLSIGVAQAVLGSVLTALGTAGHAQEIRADDRRYLYLDRQAPSTPAGFAEP